jgi:hypothetical protein
MRPLHAVVVGATGQVEESHSGSRSNSGSRGGGGGYR